MANAILVGQRTVVDASAANDANAKYRAASSQDLSTCKANLAAHIANETAHNSVSKSTTTKQTMAGALTITPSSTLGDKQVRNIYISTSDPSGSGFSVGDLWFKYDNG